MKFFKKKPVSTTEPFQDAIDFAEKFVALDDSRSKQYDYSIDSLKLLDEMLGEASGAYKQKSIDDKALDMLTKTAGSYVFEVMRRIYGGTYKWYDRLDQPILVIGEPEFNVGFLAIEKVKGRIVNGPEDNIPFFIEGVIQRINSKESALIV